MARSRKHPDGALAQPRTRRQFLAQLVVPAAAAIASVPLASALAPALAAGATKAAKKTAVRPAAAGDPFASARPDVSVARTPAERATLEKQWKGMVETVEVIRKAEVAESTPPALSFAALARDGGGTPRRGR